MHIIHVAAEMAPIAKVGGLGDVVLGLSRELIRQGSASEVILPKYPFLDYSQIEGMRIALQDLWCFFDRKWQHCTVWAGFVRGIKVYLIESHTAPYYFDRERIYGEPDDLARFLLFSRAAFELLALLPQKPDILHLHEWTTAAIAPLYRQAELKVPPIVMTLHNLEHQGRCPIESLEQAGIKLDAQLKEGQGANLLKGGILHADWVTTVSPSYAREIQTPEYSFGLDQVMQAVSNRCSGILNGLDHYAWGPGIDPYLPVPYSASDLANKKKSKEELRARLAMGQGDGPLVACVARLVPQKGVHLIKHALATTIQQGGQFVLLGSASDPKIKQDFHMLKIHYSTHPDIHLELRHNEELTHLIYAASDLFIVPSLFEPCGLTQLIAMRYGSLPIVRKTGGLQDTVFDETNGFTFEEPTFEALEEALYRALALWHKDKKKWHKLVENGMSAGTSWEKPCAAYLEVYQTLTELRASVPKGVATSSEG